MSSTSFGWVSISGESVPKMDKIGQNVQAARPGTSTYTVASSIQRHNDMYTISLNHGLKVGLIKWTERFGQESKDPQLWTNSSTSQWSTTLDNPHALVCNISKMEGEIAQKLGLPALPRPAGLSPRFFRPKQLITNSRSKLEAFTRKRWPRGHIPRPAGPTQQCLNLDLRVEVNHDRLTCLQLTHRAIPTLKHYKQTTHLHL